MIGLIRNEWMKLFSKVSTYIFIGIMVVGMVGAGFIANFQNASTEQEVKEAEKTLANPNATEDDKMLAAETLANSEVYMTNTVWDFMADWAIGLISFITLFTVIVCSGMVASEFSDGTIKQLLIRPHKRWKILLSKYVTSILFAGMLLLSLLVSGYLVGIAFFGNGSFTAEVPDPALSGGMVEVGGYFMDMLLYWIPGFFIIITIAFMLSTLFKTTSIAVGVAVFILFASSTLNIIILNLVERYSWMKFILFPHLDLRSLFLFDFSYEDASIGFSLGLLVVYYLLFIALTFFVFKRRDISI
ncbi:ABC transporter permease subunit [Pradoshia sp.]